jgi:tRNA pseudouridine55 synthase
MPNYRTGEVLFIAKPLKWTSFQVVNKIKHLIKPHASFIEEGVPKRIKPKVGHAGTLDPLATGLLIICTGKETKNIVNYQAQEKEYTGTFLIGSTTPCFDLEQEVDHTFPTDHITEELLHETTKQFTGSIQQAPPIYSAIKINGRRAYDIAREGGTAEIRTKEVTISIFEITNIDFPTISFRVVCTKGTYIRSLARDFGLALKSGAHLTSLCRTRIGEYKLADAISLQEFENKQEK